MLSCASPRLVKWWRSLNVERWNTAAGCAPQLLWRCTRSLRSPSVPPHCSPDNKYINRNLFLWPAASSFFIDEDNGPLWIPNILPAHLTGRFSFDPRLGTPHAQETHTNTLVRTFCRHLTLLRVAPSNHDGPHLQSGPEV